MELNAILNLKLMYSVYIYEILILTLPIIFIFLLDDIQSQLRMVSFLPVMKRPQDSAILWAGEKSGSDLLSPEILYPSELHGVLCYVEPIMDSTALGIACKLLRYSSLPHVTYFYNAAPDCFITIVMLFMIVFNCY